MILKATAVTVATLALFFQDLKILFTDALQSEITSYLLAIPMLFGYLIYRKRKMLRAVIPQENKKNPRKTRCMPLVAGTLLSLTAILVYWYGSFSFTPLEYHMFALPIFVAGLTLIIFNPQTLRQLAFPIAFLFFLMPPPTEMLYTAGAALSALSAEASHLIVHALGIPSALINDYDSPTIEITRPDGQQIPFTVDIACSGIYSLIGFVVFATFIAYILRDKLWKKTAIFLLGAPLIYLLNITRITTMLLLGYFYGETLAIQVFHLLGGWILIFLGTLLLLTVAEIAFKTRIFTGPQEKCGDCSAAAEPVTDSCYTCGRLLKPAIIKFTKTDALKIATVILAVALLMSVQAPVFAMTEALGIMVTTPTGEQVMTEILPELRQYDLHFPIRDTDFEARAKQDMTLEYLYTSKDGSLEPVWVTLEIASTRSSLHRWETCLITWPLSKGYQPKVNRVELTDIQLVQNPPIIARMFVFQYRSTNETQAVLYWYETATFTVNSTSQQKHVKISVIAYPETLETDDNGDGLPDIAYLPEIQNQMIELATAVANHWQPIKTWSQITFILSRNGINSAAITTAALAAITIFHTVETRKKRKESLIAYEKLSSPNRQLIDTVREIEKSRAPTLCNIAEHYENVAKRNDNEQQILEMLSELEKTGIIENKTENFKDEPIQVWKTQTDLSDRKRQLEREAVRK